VPLNALSYLDVGDTTVDVGHTVHGGIVETLVVQRGGLNRSIAQSNGVLHRYVTRRWPAGVLVDRAVWWVSDVVSRRNKLITHEYSKAYPADAIGLVICIRRPFSSVDS